MTRPSLRPLSKTMMAKAERGANRLESLLQRHLDPAELCDALGAVRARALMRYSKKFFRQSRELMDRFGTKYGDGSRSALAYTISIAAQKEDFSINYDSWLRSFEMLADALHSKGMDVPEFFGFSFSPAVKACESYEKLDAAVRVSIEYMEKFGNPCVFCRDVLPHMAALPFSTQGFAKACNLLMAWLQSSGTDGKRHGLLREAERMLVLSGAIPANAKEFMDFLERGAPSS